MCPTLFVPSVCHIVLALRVLVLDPRRTGLHPSGIATLRARLRPNAAFQKPRFSWTLVIRARRWGYLRGSISLSLQQACGNHSIWRNMVSIEILRHWHLYVPVLSVHPDASWARAIVQPIGQALSRSACLMFVRVGNRTHFVTTRFGCWCFSEISRRASCPCRE